jgi:hypothetical protein
VFLVFSRHSCWDTNHADAYVGSLSNIGVSDVTGAGAVRPRHYCCLHRYGYSAWTRKGINDKH